jgi:hypothetical protein
MEFVRCIAYTVICYHGIHAICNLPRGHTESREMSVVNQEHKFTISMLYLHAQFRLLKNEFTVPLY